MKKTLTIFTILYACVMNVSCCNVPQKRHVDDIFHDVLKAYGDSTATEHFIALMNEYADSLYSEIVNSPLDEIGLRAMAQKRAGDAMSLCIPYLTPSLPRISELVEKFDKVLMTWRAVLVDENALEYAYLKEILFVADKETEYERDEVISFIVRTSEYSRSVVMIPEGEDDAQLEALFCDKAPSGSGQLIDIEEGNTILVPDVMSHEDKTRRYYFHGRDFFEQMMAHDYLFVVYTTEEEDCESVMVNLDRFHNLVHSTNGN